MREIIMDTETTGFDPRKGDKLIEIGCIELVNRIPSGREYHCFINPERDVPAEAQAVHGITTEFLLDKPTFPQVAQSFLDFIGGDPLIIHNAQFDIGFLNFELGEHGFALIAQERVTCTLQLARRRHPAGPNTLDALCKRYGIDNSKRTKHGALVDLLLLAEVYIELLGVRQATFVDFAAETAHANGNEPGFSGKRKAMQRPAPLAPRLDAAMVEAHVEFVKSMGEKALWRRYISVVEDA